jgi:MtrB/PioB family decaheme-associated outer membrane protein
MKTRDRRRDTPPMLFGGAFIFALTASTVHASEDPDVAALTQPSSTLELGTGYVSNDSYKFGQYNGLQNRGAVTLGNLDLRGGGSYDSDSRIRWRLSGNDLGLETRDAALDFRDQGRFTFSLGFDSFRRNISDTYTTPYIGAGTTSLALPAGWLKPIVPQVNGTSLNFRSLSPVAGIGSVVSPTGVVTAPTAAQLATLGSIRAADISSVSGVRLQTERKREELGFGVMLAPRWQFTGSIRHEAVDGSRPIGALSAAVQEQMETIPELVDTTTDQFNLALDYARPKGSLRAAYYGSIFKNDVASISWQDPSDPLRTASLGTAPSGKFHQLSLTGSYSPFTVTHVVADLSYGRSTQNEALLTDASLPVGVPRASANARVISQAAHLKISQRLPGRVNLLAHYRYDSRDDQTPIGMFVFYDANLQRVAAASPFNAALGLAPNTLGSNVNIFSNRPQDKRVNEFDLTADRTLGTHSKVSAGYDWEKINRRCDDTWFNCVNVNESIERTLHGQWRVELAGNVVASATYAHGERRVHYDPNAWLAFVPMANVIPGSPTVGATISVGTYLAQTGLTGFGPLAGFPAVPLTGNAAIFSPNNNIVPQSQYGSRDNVSELPGMRRFNLADRDRDKLRAAAEWQATERLGLQATFELNRDDYSHSQYGLLSARNWSAGFDADFALGERLSAAAYYTHEQQRSEVAGDGFGSNANAAFVGRAGNTAVSGGCFNTVTNKNLNGKIDPCLNWTTDMRDHTDTFGASLTRKGLLGRRLDLSGDAFLTRARTTIDVAGGSYANNPLALAGAPVLPSGEPAIIFVPAANYPAVTTRIFEIDLSARYAISKTSNVRLRYSFQRLKAVDFLYDGLQFGTAATQMPTGEQAPNYSVHVVGLYYAHRY